jgi:hypothetical protein
MSKKAEDMRKAFAIAILKIKAFILLLKKGYTE